MFIIYDTEYTTWKGCQENGWTGNQKKEIVQISALKVNKNFEVVDVFNQLCQPIVNPTLSDYFINLTHITNEQVKENGIPFKQAYEKFKKFSDNLVCYSHSWGKDFYHKSDGEVIEENLKINNMPTDNTVVYRNLGAVFKQLYENHNISVKSQSSGEIVKVLKIENRLSSLNLDVHNALFDVYSILEGLKYFGDEAKLLLCDK